MNENDSNERPGFFGDMARDEGVHRALAGVVVAVIVAGAKKLIFAS